MIKFLQRVNFYCGWLPVGALFGLMAFAAHIEVKDLDLWLHLAVGRFITLQKTIPQIDFLSFTVAGQPWLNHEWLFQVIVANINDKFGTDGLLTMQAVIVVITLSVLLAIGYRRQNQILISILLLFVGLVFQTRFTLRPDIFSLFFFVMFVYILFTRLSQWWSVYALIVIQLLWVNMHGFFFLGPVCVLISLLAQMLRCFVLLPANWNKSGRLTDMEFKRLLFIFISVCVTCLCNPSFVKGALYPLTMVFHLGGEQKIFFSFIQELQAPLSMATWLSLDGFVYYKLLILLSLVSFVINRRNVDIGVLLFWVFFLLFSLKAARNVTFFAFAAYVSIIFNCRNIIWSDVVPITFRRKQFQYITGIFINILIVLWIFSYTTTISSQGYFDFDKYLFKSEFGGISQHNFPSKAVDFLVDNGIHGNIFNDFNSGAYLIGRTSPNIKVFIDGRTELYGVSFFNKYRSVWQGNDVDAFNVFVKQYDIGIVFLNSIKQNVPHKIARYLLEDKEWQLVYLNFDAIIFVKDNDKYKDVIKEYVVKSKNWVVKEEDFIRIGSQIVDPYRNLGRALNLSALKWDELAVQEAMMAIELNPRSAKAYGIIGEIYLKDGRVQDAFQYFRTSVLFNPRDKKIRLGLAKTYMHLEEYAQAINQYQVIVRLWPRDIKGMYLLAKAYDMAGNGIKAKEMYLKILNLDPNYIRRQNNLENGQG
ncbi:MAG: tetratricopeptide (TPR) repeat protein [Candidatus Omnitrophota bacterium]|jgi:tetratricopeptide (TPR) repeat protein